MVELLVIRFGCRQLLFSILTANRSAVCGRLVLRWLGLNMGGFTTELANGGVEIDRIHSVSIVPAPTRLVPGF